MPIYLSSHAHNIKENNFLGVRNVNSNVYLFVLIKELEAAAATKSCLMKISKMVFYLKSILQINYTAISTCH